MPPVTKIMFQNNSPVPLRPAINWKAQIGLASVGSIYNDIKFELWKATQYMSAHEDIIKWKHFTRYWPFVRGIHRSPVNSPQKVTRSFDGFFDLRLNKRLSKHWRGRWYETSSCPLWRHCNAVYLTGRSGSTHRMVNLKSVSIMYAV